MITSSTERSYSSRTWCPGRTVGLVCRIEDRPAVLIVDLPDHENDQFKLVPYGLFALKRLHNNGLKFNGSARAGCKSAAAGPGRRADDRLSRLEPGPSGVVRDRGGLDAGDARQPASLGSIPPNLRRGDRSVASWSCGESAAWPPSSSAAMRSSTGARGCSTRDTGESSSASSPRFSAAKRRKRRPSSSS